MIIFSESDSLTYQALANETAAREKAKCAHWEAKFLHHIDNGVLLSEGLIKTQQIENSREKVGAFTLTSSTNGSISVAGAVDFDYVVFDGHRSYDSGVVFEEYDIDSLLLCVTKTENQNGEQDETQNNYTLLVYNGFHLVTTITHIQKDISISRNGDIEYRIMPNRNQIYFERCVFHRDSSSISTLRTHPYPQTDEHLIQRPTEPARYPRSPRSSVPVRFHVNNSKRSLILEKFAQQEYMATPVSPIFKSDATRNYGIRIPLRRVEDVAFAYYCLQSGDFGGHAIFGQPIERYANDLCKTTHNHTTSIYDYVSTLLEELQEQTSTSKNVVKSNHRIDENHCYHYSTLNGNEQMSFIGKWLSLHHSAYRSVYNTANYNSGELKVLLSGIRRRAEKIYQEVIDSNPNMVKWRSEYELFKMILSIYQEAIFQYRPSFLGTQSLDIFVPTMHIGIEYQGRQHFESVDFFGSDDALKKRQELDARKKKLCRENGIHLIEWRYDDPISLETLRKKLKQAANIPI